MGYDKWIKEFKYLTKDRINDYLKENGMLDRVMNTLPGLIHIVDTLKLTVEQTSYGQLKVMYNNNM